jgi:hypothetical protein
MEKKVHLFSVILQLNSFLFTLGKVELLLFDRGNTLSICLFTTVIIILILCFKALLQLHWKEFTLTQTIFTAEFLRPYSL